MKKLISLLVIFTLILVFSITAFADNSISIGEVEYDGSNLTISFSTSGLGASDQVTLLTYKADSSEEEDHAENLVNVDQIDKSNNTEISFPVAEALSGTYQIKMGGTGIASPDVMSITIDDNMPEQVVFANNPIGLYNAAAPADEYVLNDKGGITKLSEGTNYIAAYAVAPQKNGMTIKEYGIRINGNDYSAKVNLTNSGKYAMLFKGDGITVGYDYVAFPYVTYSAGDIEITYYGNSVTGEIIAEAED